MLPTRPDDPQDERVRTTWLAARLAEGDTESFDELYEHVAPALFAWARLRIPALLRSQLDAQDLVQEVWFRALRRFELFDPSAGTFRAWIFRIGKNTLLEALRKLGPMRRQEPRTNSSCFSPLDGIPESITSIGSRLAADESVQRFLAFAGSISPEDRQILLLCGLETTSCRETAPLVGMNEEAVAKRWQRLRALLREKSWSRELLDAASLA